MEGVPTVGLCIISTLLASEASFIEGQLPIGVSINESFASKVRKSILTQFPVYGHFYQKD